MAKTYESPALFERDIDRMLMYLGRYGYQDAATLLHVPSVVLRSWVARIAEFLEEERQSLEEYRR